MEEHDEIVAEKRSSRGASTSLFLGMVAMVASVVVVGGFVGMLAIWLGKRLPRGIYESEGRIGGARYGRRRSCHGLVGDRGFGGVAGGLDVCAEDRRGE